MQHHHSIRPFTFYRKLHCTLPTSQCVYRVQQYAGLPSYRPASLNLTRKDFAKLPRVEPVLPFEWQEEALGWRRAEFCGEIRDQAQLVLFIILHRIRQYYSCYFPWKT
ncbi:hypothetical protein Mapa_002754 [Marchantia paleacea]|nr:hypothetical protein Mapa_002754 [Marchantia paleacea]